VTRNRWRKFRSVVRFKNFFTASNLQPFPDCQRPDECKPKLNGRHGMEIFLWLMLILVFVCSRKSTSGKGRADLMVLVVVLSTAFLASTLQ
jgi:hypothetical protein